MTNEVVINVLVINLSDELVPFKRGVPLGEALKVGELPPQKVTKGRGGRSRGRVGEVNTTKKKLNQSPRRYNFDCKK